jgi:hypothetical protein
MLKSLNLIANGLICLGGLFFYVMLFTKVGDGVKQIDQFGKVSYHTIRTGLAFIVAGALLNVLLLTVPPFSEILMNFGFGLLLSWASIWHGKKFGVLTGVKAIDRKTATYRVPPRVEDTK